MGLDMYLYKKTYVQNWEHNPPEQHHQIEIKRGGVLRKDIKPNRICYITEQVAYWRKFNALHGWFVENCGGGVDECQQIHVGEDNMKELLETLKKVKSLTSKLVVLIIDEKNLSEDDIKEVIEPCREYIEMIRIAIDPERFDLGIKKASVVRKLGYKVAFNVMYLSKWIEEKNR